jgi:RpiR family transcriptional regulator, carbohydrate utilization regulator
MLAAIRAFPRPLSAAHARIARFVLEHPHIAVQHSVAELAKAAKVSEPTVIRFCRQLGSKSFSEFRLAILHEISADGAANEVPELSPADTVESAADKMLAASAETLQSLRRTLPMDAVRHAAVATLKARWVHIYGFGSSATVAADAQNKLFRLAAMTVAHNDPHVQAMAASTLGPEDVIIAISASGTTRELIETIEIGLANGVTVIGVTRPGSPLARRCSILLPVRATERREIFTPLTTRVAQLAVIDALVVGVTLLSPPTVIAERLGRMDDALNRRRVADSKDNS